jgi:hypothetical protein
MDKTLAARERIYNHIQDFSRCGWHASCSHTEFERYCIAKDTIQDTAEALFAHREQGFVDDVYRRYVEYYGVLQAVFMQQDAIEFLFNLFLKPEEFKSDALPNWQELRALRNNTVGHPVDRLKRLNRNGIAYGCVIYSWCPGEKTSSWKSKDVNLAALLDAYDSEAASVLDSVYRRLETDCATKHIK